MIDRTTSIRRVRRTRRRAEQLAREIRDLNEFRRKHGFPAIQTHAISGLVAAAAELDQMLSELEEPSSRNGKDGHG